MTEVDPRYSNIELTLPVRYRPLVERLVRTSGAGDSAPFERQIDLWWIAFCIGVRIWDESDTSVPGEQAKFNTGVILTSDPWRLTHLELLYLGRDKTGTLGEPRQVIEHAAKHVQIGLRWLEDKVFGEADPTVALLHHLEEFRRL